MEMEKVTPDISTMCKNDKGEWVPAIPLPYYERLRLKKCKCGEMFFTENGYRGHYALRHILEL
jgi:hypothetical protein